MSYSAPLTEVTIVSMETARIHLMGITWAVSQQIGSEVIDIGNLEVTHASLVTVEVLLTKSQWRTIGYDSAQADVECFFDNIEKKLEAIAQCAWSFFLTEKKIKTFNVP